MAAAAVTAAPSASLSSDGNNNNNNHVDTAANHHIITNTKAAATKPPPPTKKQRSSKSSSGKKGSAEQQQLVNGGSGSGGGIDSNNYNEDTTVQPIDSTTITSSSFQPMSLSQIQLRIKLLLDKLPSVLPEIPPDYINPDDDETTTTSNNNNNKSPPNNHNNNARLYPPIKSFASNLQLIIEEYNLLLSLVSSATYQWGVDRSGASQQNLSVMSSELQQCQEVITSVVSGRLSNVLCPAVDVLVGRVEIVRGVGDGGGVGGSIGDDEESGTTKTKKRKLLDEATATTKTTNHHHQHHSTTTNTTTTSTSTTNEQRINHYTRPLVDPSYVHLCHQIVARNGEMLRYTVATCIHTAQCVIGDYLKAMKKDVGHEVNKGGYY